MAIALHDACTSVATFGHIVRIITYIRFLVQRCSCLREIFKHGRGDGPPTFKMFPPLSWQVHSCISNVGDVACLV